MSGNHFIILGRQKVTLKKTELGALSRDGKIKLTSSIVA